MKNIVPFLKSFLVHGDFENMPDDFDIFDEVEIWDRKRKTPGDKVESRNADEETPDIKCPTNTNTQPRQKFNDPLIDMAFGLFKDDDEPLQLLRNSLQDIRDCEMELDNGFEQITHEFNNKKEYNYEKSTKKIKW
jgi:hypothetical protein